MSETLDLSKPTLGVVSDVHGEIETTARAFDEFKKRGVERVICCGDLGDLEILDVFRRIPTDFVAGNCDASRREALAVEIPKIGGRFWGDFGEIEWRGKRIFWTHGHGRLEDRIADEAYSELWDLICFGHTHRFETRRYNQTLILNPGAIQARGEKPSCAVLDAELRIERVFPATFSFWKFA